MSNKIYARPTVNQRMFVWQIGNKTTGLIPVAVEYVGRKYFNVRPEEEFLRIIEFEIESRRQRGETQFYRIYESEQEYTDERERASIESFLRHEFSYDGACRSLPLESLRQIKAIVEPHVKKPNE